MPNGEGWRLAVDHTRIFPVADVASFVALQRAAMPDSQPRQARCCGDEAVSSALSGGAGVPGPYGTAPQRLERGFRKEASNEPPFPRFLPRLCVIHWLMVARVFAMLFISLGMVSPLVGLCLMLALRLALLMLVLVLVRLSLRLATGAPALPHDLSTKQKRNRSELARPALRPAFHLPDDPAARSGTLWLAGRGPHGGGAAVRSANPRPPSRCADGRAGPA